MFPSVDCGEVELPDECCTMLWDQGSELLAAISAPVLACQAAGPCGGPALATFISLGRPETWQTDFIAVWLNGFSYSNKSLQPSGAMLIRPVLRAEWNALIWESNYPGYIPGPDNGPGYAPTDAQWHAANHHAYAHGEAMLRGVMEFATSSTCSDFVLRGFGPATPENYAAGWLLGIALDVEI